MCLAAVGRMARPCFRQSHDQYSNPRTHHRASAHPRASGVGDEAAGSLKHAAAERVGWLAGELRGRIGPSPVPLYACPCSLLLGTERNPALFLIVGRFSEAGGRAFESRPGHHSFRGLTGSADGGAWAGGSSPPRAVGSGERQVGFLLAERMGVDAEGERRIGVTQLIGHPPDRLSGL